MPGCRVESEVGVEVASDCTCLSLSLDIARSIRSPQAATSSPQAAAGSLGDSVLSTPDALKEAIFLDQRVFRYSIIQVRYLGDNGISSRSMNALLPLHIPPPRSSSSSEPNPLVCRCVGFWAWGGPCVRGCLTTTFFLPCEASACSLTSTLKSLPRVIGSMFLSCQSLVTRTVMVPTQQSGGVATPVHGRTASPDASSSGVGSDGSSPHGSQDSEHVLEDSVQPAIVFW
jgi:hypothetical protein